MPVTITINGENAAHSLDELRGLSVGLLGATSFTPAAGVQMGQGVAIGNGGPVPAVDPHPAAETTTQKSGRGRPKKAEQPAEPVAEVKTTEPEQKADPEAQRVNEIIEKVKAEQATLTLDDLRKAAKPYIDKFTMAAAQVDLQDCLEDAVGNGRRAISQLADADQETLKKAVDAFYAASEAKERYVRKTSFMG